eukprot:15308629-Alexandrium_andersonii.AAC.1
MRPGFAQRWPAVIAFSLGDKGAAALGTRRSAGSNSTCWRRSLRRARTKGRPMGTSGGPVRVE